MHDTKKVAFHARNIEFRVVDRVSKSLIQGKNKAGLEAVTLPDRLCHGEAKNMLPSAYMSQTLFIPGLVHGQRGVEHAAGKAPFIVVPGHDADKGAIDDFCTVEAEQRRMRVVIEIG